MIRIIFFLAIVLGINIPPRPETGNVLERHLRLMKYPTEKWPFQKSNVNVKAQDILNDCRDNAFETSFDALYNVANRDDLKLYYRRRPEEQNAMETSKYPETLKKRHR
jgi:hypothetical protein